MSIVATIIKLFILCHVMCSAQTDFKIADACIKIINSIHRFNRGQTNLACNCYMYNIVYCVV